MRYLIKLVTVYLGFTGVLCALAVGLGHAANKQALLPEIRQCGPSLCYLSIEPLKTAWDEALRVCNSTGDLAGAANFPNSYDKQSAPYYRVHLSQLVAPNSTVSEIELAFKEWTITAGALVTRFGPPCRVVFLGFDVVTVYESAAFFFRTDGRLLTPGSPSMAIRLLGANPKRCLSTSSLFKSYAWQGFRRYPPPRDQ